MAFFSNQNVVLIDNCKNLHDVTVKLVLTEDLITFQDTGFSLQLNAFPPKGQLSQTQELTWFQYVIWVTGGSLSYEIQYWASYPHPWPLGYKPVPNTVPHLPVLPNDYNLTRFGPAPSNRIARGSELKISLSTDSAGHITRALFSYTDPSGHTTSTTFPFPAGAQYPICAFTLNLGGYKELADSTFISGAGTLTYSVSLGSLADQGGGVGTACGETSADITGELSNALYGPLTPPSGSIVSQSLSFVSEGPLAGSLDNGVIYAITHDYQLLWYRHTGIADGHNSWAGHLPVPTGNIDGQIGGGWKFKQVFSGGNGVIYAITDDHRLLWYRHSAFADGQSAWTPPPALTDAEKKAGKVDGQIGGGWDFLHVFSGGNGVIYAITHDHRLLWYRHTGYADGHATWAPHLPVPKGQLDGQIGGGWDFEQVF